jgi:H/ACA ribonucleoprotein complex subunit 4
VKDTAINSICYGANLSQTGVIGIEKNLENKEKIILISLKGEPIGFAINNINKKFILLNYFELFIQIRFLIMKRDFYPKQWNIGVISAKKNILNSIGILGYMKKKKFKIAKWWGKNS